MSELEYLFQPLTMRGVTVPNRIFSSAHMTNFADPVTHLPTERHARYYEARAKGGIGLIMMEAQSITQHNCPIPPVCIADNDDVIPRYKMITDAVHQYDTKILCQLWHNGNENISKVTWAPSQSASNIPSVLGEVPVELEVEDIKDIIDRYISTTKRAIEGGFDGIEFHIGHGYLPQQFMSPAFNIRKDEYGGSLDNRIRFCLEVIDAIRREIGEERVLGMRMSGDELMDHGLTLDDMKEISQRFEETGQLDFLHVTVGNYGTAIVAIAPMMIPLRPLVYLASEIKQVVDMPVFTVCRINDPVMADDIIKNNEADMVAMTRATICDPELPNKAKEDKLDEIRMCMACNEGCWSRCEKGYPITCIQNPESGREGELKITPAPQKKKVMVIGGGPGGLSAARVAALRGHDVTLYEKNEELGGQVLLAGNIEPRAEIKECIRNLEKELNRLSVEIKLGVEVTPEMVIAEDSDEVIVATGALPIEKPTPDLVGPHHAIDIDPDADIVSAWRVMEGTAETGQKVLIYDTQLHLQGLLAAEKLLDEGKEVQMIQAAMRGIGPASDADGPTFAIQLVNTMNKGLELIPLYELTQIVPGMAYGRNKLTMMPREFPCDTVVTSYWRLPNAQLFKDLKGKVKSLQRVGDCLAPRYIGEAIYEGYMAAYDM
jgi:2,4-dienoyl-CoA reductase-like NADH-dependent reductase (Old Yellow Enzyme family)